MNLPTAEDVSKLMEEWNIIESTGDDSIRMTTLFRDNSVALYSVCDNPDVAVGDDRLCLLYSQRMTLQVKAVPFLVEISPYCSIVAYHCAKCSLIAGKAGLNNVPSVSDIIGMGIGLKAFLETKTKE